MVQQSWKALQSLFEKEDVIFKKSAAAIETKYITDLNSEWRLKPIERWRSCEKHICQNVFGGRAKKYAPDYKNTDIS
ncbi:MAG: hypothetical protein LBJ58_03600 [Tannerellaceae bacterium]|jgi:hypothetical protein|nr:hypothetical protein [Tannerellaceae bacterium]